MDIRFSNVESMGVSLVTGISNNPGTESRLLYSEMRDIHDVIGDPATTESEYPSTEILDFTAPEYYPMSPELSKVLLFNEYTRYHSALSFGDTVSTFVGEHTNNNVTHSRNSFRTSLYALNEFLEVYPMAAEIKSVETSNVGWNSFEIDVTVETVDTLDGYILISELQNPTPHSNTHVNQFSWSTAETFSQGIVPNLSRSTHHRFVGMLENTTHEITVHVGDTRGGFDQDQVSLVTTSALTIEQSGNDRQDVGRGHTSGMVSFTVGDPEPLEAYLQYKASNSLTWKYAMVTPVLSQTFESVIDGLTPNTTYSTRVRVNKFETYSNWHESESTFTTTEIARTVENLRCVSSSLQTLSFEWDPVASNPGILDYRVIWSYVDRGSPDEDEVHGEVTVDQTSTSVTLTGLNYDSTVHLTVFSRNKNGYSPEPMSIRQPTPATSPPQRPEPPSTVLVGESFLGLRWPAVDSDPPVSTYTVAFDVYGDGDYSEVSEPILSNTHTLRGDTNTYVTYNEKRLTEATLPVRSTSTVFNPFEFTPIVQGEINRKCIVNRTEYYLSEHTGSTYYDGNLAKAFTGFYPGLTDDLYQMKMVVSAPTYVAFGTMERSWNGNLSSADYTRLRSTVESWNGATILGVDTSGTLGRFAYRNSATGSDINADKAERNYFWIFVKFTQSGTFYFDNTDVNFIDLVTAIVKQNPPGFVSEISGPGVMRIVNDGLGTVGAYPVEAGWSYSGWIRSNTDITDEVFFPSHRGTPVALIISREYTRDDPKWGYTTFDEVLDMQVGYQYEFELTFEGNSGDVHGGMIFGHDPASNEELENTPGCKLFMKHNANGTWTAFHRGQFQPVWRDAFDEWIDSEDGDDVDDFATPYPAYWRLTVVQRGLVRDLRLEGYLEPGRSQLDVWAYVSELGDWHTSQDYTRLQHDTIRFGLIVGTGKITLRNFSNTKRNHRLAADEWHHVARNITLALGKWYIRSYIDGSVRGSDHEVVSPDPDQEQLQMIPTASGGFSVSNFAIWNRIVTSGEIQEMYSDGHVGTLDLYDSADSYFSFDSNILDQHGKLSLTLVDENVKFVKHNDLAFPPATDVHVKIKAINKTGGSEWSVPAMLRTGDTTVPVLEILNVTSSDADNFDVRVLVDDNNVVDTLHAYVFATLGTSSPPSHEFVTRLDPTSVSPLSRTTIQTAVSWDEAGGIWVPLSSNAVYTLHAIVKDSDNNESHTSSSGHQTRDLSPPILTILPEVFSDGTISVSGSVSDSRGLPTLVELVCVYGEYFHIDAYAIQQAPDSAKVTLETSGDFEHVFSTALYPATPPTETQRITSASSDATLTYYPNMVAMQHIGASHMASRLDNVHINMVPGNMYEYQIGTTRSRTDGSQWRMYGGFLFGDIDYTKTTNNINDLTHEWGVRVPLVIWKYTTYDFWEMDMYPNDVSQHVTFTSPNESGDTRSIKYTNMDFPGYVRITVVPYGDDVKIDFFTDPARTSLFFSMNLSAYTTKDNLSYILHQKQLRVGMYHGTPMGGDIFIKDFKPIVDKPDAEVLVRPIYSNNRFHTMYRATDTSGNETRVTNVVDAVDTSPPVVTFRELAVSGSGVHATLGIHDDSLGNDNTEVGGGVVNIHSFASEQALTDIQIKNLTDPTTSIRVSDLNASNADVSWDPSSLAEMSVVSVLSNGDMVHVSSSYESNEKHVGHIFDGISSVWDHAWHGGWNDEPSVIYHFTDEVYVNQMRFVNTPSLHPAGSIRIEVWDGYMFVEATNASSSGFPDHFIETELHLAEVYITFDTVKTHMVRVHMSPHVNSSRPELVGLSEWSIWHTNTTVANANGFVGSHRETVRVNSDSIQVTLSKSIESGYVFPVKSPILVSSFESTLYPMATMSKITIDAVSAGTPQVSSVLTPFAEAQSAPPAEVLPTGFEPLPYLSTKDITTHTPGTVSYSNNNRTAAVNGVSGSLWFYMTFEQIILMTVGNEYEFDIWFDHRNVSRAYGGILFGHTLPMDQKHDTLPAATLTYRYEYQTQEVQQWHSPHTSVWKSVSGGLIDNTDIAHTTTKFTSTRFPTHWKLTVVQRSGFKDLKMEGYTSSARDQLVTWAYVTEVNRENSQDENAAVESLQHDYVHFGSLHKGGGASSHILENFNHTFSPQ